MSDERRTRGHIPWRKVDLRLRSLREIWVATATPDGRPDAVPVWFWWDGEYAYFSTKAHSRKARNIAAQPAVVLHNGDGADPILIKGDAAPVTDRDDLDRVDRAYAEKYVDPHSGAQATIFVEGDNVYRVRPRLVMTWEYATCSTRTDWELA
jgi:nitroimidazol reductase NimA-like FMN-containing flavoprotein (pyridoxamine 5'-phosphate oxidase superfamily)